MINTQETINQLGGRGFTSALAYTGTSSVIELPSRNAICFKVNGRRNYQTYIEVQLAPNDTYTVKVLSKKGSSKSGEPTLTLNTQNEVYCDELQDVFEQMYDNHMNKVSNGFIPLS